MPIDDLPPGSVIKTPNVPRMSNPSDAAKGVPPGMGELNYIQLLLKGVLDQTLYTTSSPTFAGLTITGLTASQLVGTDASKAFQSVSPGTSLSLSGTTLNAIQGIRTVDSPTFAGLTLTGITGILKAAAGVIAAATIGSSLSYSAPTLDTIQDIRTTATPSFGGLTVTKATYPVIRGTRSTSLTNEIRAGISVEHATTGNMADGFGGGFSFDIKDSAGVSNPIGGVFGVRAGADNTGDLWFQTYVVGTGYYRMILKSNGALNLMTASALGLLDSDSSHHLRLNAGSNLSVDRILTLTTGDAARTLTLNGNPTLDDWFDQAVKQASSPTFAGATIGSLAGVILGTAGVLSALDYVPWTTPAYSAGDYTANGSMTWTVESGDVGTYEYTIIGKHMLVQFYVHDTVVGGTPNNELHIAIPASKVATHIAFGFCHVYNNATFTMDFCQVLSSGTTIQILHNDYSNFVAGNTAVYGMIFFQIN